MIIFLLTNFKIFGREGKLFCETYVEPSFEEKDRFPVLSFDLRIFLCKQSFENFYEILE